MIAGRGTGAVALVKHPPDQYPMASMMPLMAIVNWRALALKRLAHLDELKRSGRWQRHFTSEAAFEAALGEAAANAEEWKRLAYQGETPPREAAE